MELFADAEFWSSAVVPLAFLSGSWLLTRKRKFGFRVAVMASCIVVSLPAGIVYIFSVIGWTYLLDAHHSPGVGVVLIPLIMSWLACLLFWGAWSTFALANKIVRSRLHPTKH